MDVDAIESDSSCSSDKSSAHSSYGNENNSLSSCSSSRQSNHAKAFCDDDTSSSCYTTEVKKWTERVPIGMGLCPWAVKSNNLKRITYSLCESASPSEVASFVVQEAELLCSNFDNTQHLKMEGGKGKCTSLRTTLIVCSNVKEWIYDFLAFENYLKDFPKNACPLEQTENYKGRHTTASPQNNRGKETDILSRVTLVPFHPKFLRWRGLPEGVAVGSKVKCHRSQFGTNEKSSELYAATILEVNSRPFGRRRVKVRWIDDHEDETLASIDAKTKMSNRRNEQYIPTDWVVHETQKEQSISRNERMELPDNMMHRAPYPTIHVIDNRDLYSLCVRDISRLKRKNAQLMVRKFG
mmetsp:Transcript_15286/g.32069  ORF Transcript_15286/g.32069 Transcript_15286/m.32069 type:complete len:353 (-) Transcript_15286:102-1160(-)